MNILLHHLTGWIVYFLITYFYNLSAGFKGSPIAILALIVLIMPAYYGVDYIIRDFQSNRGWMRSVLLGILGYLIAVGGSYVIIYHALPLTGIEFHRPDVEFAWRDYAINVGTYYLRIWAYAILLHLIRTRIKSHRAQHKAEQAYDKLSTRFLGFQISQHFVINALGTVIQRSRNGGNEPGARIMERFADLYTYSQRYVLSGATLVSLTQEADALHDFTRMVTLQHQGKEVLIFDISGNLDSHKIPPLSLLTFADNIVKYGHLSEQHPASMHLESDDLGYRFIARNKIRTRLLPQPLLRGTGIGLQNTMQRLDALMPDNFRLSTKNEDQYFEIRLQVKQISHDA